MKTLSKANAGFTLIEVLVAMLILAVGLLGLAALQASSLKNNQSAYYRSQATQLAYDIADRMRVNTSMANNYLTSFMKPSDATDQSTNCLAITSACTPSVMAEHDLYEWDQAIHASLPKSTMADLPRGEITSPNSNTYRVSIIWDENRDDNRDGTVNSPSTFSMDFRL